MSFFDPQNPGIGGIDELTPAEEAFLTSFAGLAYANGDILYYNNGLKRLPKGTNGQYLSLSGGLPAWANVSGGGGGMAIGDPVSGADFNRVLFTDGAGALAQSNNIVFDGSQFTLSKTSAGYGTSYIKLVDTTGGNTVVLQPLLGSGAGTGLYITDEAGAAVPLTLGTWKNPGDGTTFTASSGAWTISSGTLTANSFVPSSSTAPSDGFYLPAANTLGFATSSTGRIQLTATALSPISNDGNALGTASLSWADVFIASGGVINFNNGDITLTHSTDKVTFAGGQYALTGFANGTLTTITQAVLGSPMSFVSSHGVPVYMPGFVWYSFDNNATKPKAGIYAQTTGSGSVIYLGTSNNYATGITKNVQIDWTASISPAVSDNGALGTTSLMWSDAFLASGAVINFNNGDLTLTHSTGALTNSGKYIAGDVVRLKSYTVATLPTGTAGDTAYVTDGDAALAWGATVINSGAGATKYMVWFNGSNWTVTGK